ncbi:hypothetical protein L227DRAFT_194370 [Lentinus tigrinus ALCF2SS1-6]|uniref:Uncharacterized protein n=1 Tax=Lentinus tigrinus ALCF2SS1-6 TaxID=1328759 RepID=A0A5C2S3D8_9APHY|nr:hypothetical protein L227DRAFT_194370 [Lentinus tigrinus ALCF2SS1-6]
MLYAQQVTSKQPKRYVQEQVITTLAIVADASEATFAKVRFPVCAQDGNRDGDADACGGRHSTMRRSCRCCSTSISVNAMECAGLIGAFGFGTAGVVHVLIALQRLRTARPLGGDASSCTSLERRVARVARCSTQRASSVIRIIRGVEDKCPARVDRTRRERERHRGCAGCQWKPEHIHGKRLPGVRPLGDMVPETVVLRSVGAFRDVLDEGGH